jgi:hypothetical protein
MLHQRRRWCRVRSTNKSVHAAPSHALTKLKSSSQMTSAIASRDRQQQRLRRAPASLRPQHELAARRLAVGRVVGLAGDDLPEPFVARQHAVERLQLRQRPPPERLALVLTHERAEPLA